MRSYQAAARCESFDVTCPPMPAAQCKQSCIGGAAGPERQISPSALPDRARAGQHHLQALLPPGCPTSGTWLLVTGADID